MSTLTPNHGLKVPESTDDIETVREDYAYNLGKIDEDMGGGSGSGGHTIVNPSGTDMPAEGKLQFTGGVTVTDDSVNGKTVVDISGGGGNVYGAFIDPSQIITNGSYTGTLTYTAIRDCIIVLDIAGDANTATAIQINGVTVNALYHTTSGTNDITFNVPLKTGQILTVVNGNAWLCEYAVYGITQGTNGIFAPIIYSDTERVVGVWRDNKPLYQKTVNVGSLNAGQGKSVAHGIANIDTVVNYDGIGFNTVESRWNTLPRVDDDVTYQRGFSVGASNIVIQGASNVQAMTDVSVTIWYTKTTDVVGSGNWNTDGVPTVHYSTTEQVIGTWIDGKPIYQRTWDFSASPVMLTYGTWVNSGISAGENIKAIISAELKYGTVANMGVEVAVNADGYPVAFQKVENTGNTRGVTYCTLRYTKTTD